MSNLNANNLVEHQYSTRIVCLCGLYLSVTPGKIKNIQKCIPKTRMTWKMTFPMTVFLRYSARSTTMVPNWMSTITKNASGTWSSDNEEVISAAAECFWKGKYNRVVQEQRVTWCLASTACKSYRWFTDRCLRDIPQKPKIQIQWWWSPLYLRGTSAHIHRSLHCSLDEWDCRKTVWWAHIPGES